MIKHLSILGLGRCVIGHMAKYIQDNALNINFTHHYILNYETISSTDSNLMQSEYKTLNTAPSLEDQWYALNDLKKYDVVLIEIFPPSKLYKRNSMYACFESYTSQLEKFGFKESESQEDSYLQVLQNLVKDIRLKSSDIKIIFVNGELTKEVEGNFIGAKSLYDLCTNIYKSSTLKEYQIDFLDMNNILNSLEESGKFAFEYAFSYIYLRKVNNLLIYSRDTKHASSYMRVYFLYSLFEILKKYNIAVPDIYIDNFFKDKVDKSYNQRAHHYIQKFHDKNIDILSINSNQKISLLFSYSLETKDVLMIENIKLFINFFSKNSINFCSDLKKNFYQIRAIAAFVHTLDIKIIDEFYLIANKILYFSKADLSGYMNFALIWLDDIFSVLFVMVSSQEEKQKLDFLLLRLKDNKNFRGYLNMENILKKGLK